ncbi:MAG TPA: THUMP domain-containing protein [Burkholderiaceae bacterium]|nr:THUMP domain-containing protein [Burkholderiaceae bacterium]
MTAAAFFAVCPRGLEAALSDELLALGAQSLRAEAGGVAFKGSLATAYAANLHSRIASRILWQVGRRGYLSEQHLYDATQEVRWQDLMSPQQTLRVDVTASRSPLQSLEFAMLRIKDGIVDRLRELTGARPSIDRSNPDVRVFAYLDSSTVTLYVDLSGEPLFKRGWRADKGEAPLKENLAAGLLALSGWAPSLPLADLFCGSGTIIIEAASIAAGRPPGLERHFAFERLKGFESHSWRRLKDAARSAITDAAAANLVGSDISTRVIDQAIVNAQLAGLQSWLSDGRLQFNAVDARTATPAAESGMIVSNPPYGEQSAPRSASVADMMRNVGDRLKQQFSGWEAWFLTSDRQLPKQMRLQETRKAVLFNGPIECRFFRFELVAGGYRPRASALKGEG